ncbi:MAG: tRNA (adenosine(37)-N6)-threonylcarbamoyltransferase complex transferase subunit TsaD [Chloroflexaceae bacterium]|nr:tRNA (adenosine(37)-N6)-threonylcarbamoyltransferase complex transferase subunit TsaD [Chloroflexaceae bacterium]
MIGLPAGYTILGLETSCDETAAAIVRDGSTIISNVVASQIDAHQRYGGIVPEVASRQHILSIVPVIEQAIKALPEGWQGIHAVAATYGPGLSGALLTGLNTAKAIAWQRDLPFIGVNHLEAHIYANWLTLDPSIQPPQFPLVALIVSGGHTLLVLLRQHGDYQLLGQTRDDAAGEAFDKVARMLGLGFPGGPAIQRAADGVQSRFTLPRAWLRDTYDFSFSGLKTAVLHKVQEHYGNMGPPNTSAAGRVPGTGPVAGNSLSFTAQMSAAFQESVVDVLTSKTVLAAQTFGATEILLAGGVAANTRLRSELTRRANLPVRYPPIWLCTDNAAMVAAAAYYRFRTGLQHSWELDVVPGLPLPI